MVRANDYEKYYLTNHDFLLEYSPRFLAVPGVRGGNRRRSTQEGNGGFARLSLALPTKSFAARRFAGVPLKIEGFARVCAT